MIYDAKETLWNATPQVILTVFGCWAAIWGISGMKIKAKDLEVGRIPSRFRQTAVALLGVVLITLGAMYPTILTVSSVLTTRWGKHIDPPPPPPLEKESKAQTLPAPAQTAYLVIFAKFTPTPDSVAQTIDVYTDDHLQARWNLNSAHLNYMKPIPLQEGDHVYRLVVTVTAITGAVRSFESGPTPFHITGALSYEIRVESSRIFFVPAEG